VSISLILWSPRFIIYCYSPFLLALILIFSVLVKQNISLCEVVHGVNCKPKFWKLVRTHVIKKISCWSRVLAGIWVVSTHGSSSVYRNQNQTIPSDVRRYSTVSLPLNGRSRQRCTKTGRRVSTRCLHSHRHKWLLNVTHWRPLLHICCWRHWSGHHAWLCHAHNTRLPSSHHSWLLVANHAGRLDIAAWCGITYSAHNQSYYISWKRK